LKIGPQLPKLLSNIKELTSLAHSVVISLPIAGTGRYSDSRCSDNHCSDNCIKATSNPTIEREWMEEQ